MIVTRTPRARLHAAVQTVWATDGKEAASGGLAARELMLPTGRMHVVIRLSDRPFRIFAANNGARAAVTGHALIGGVRTGPYVHEASATEPSVGALLRPGAGPLLLGLPADDLSGRHTGLDEVWGRAVAEARERMTAVASLHRRLDVFETFLAARLPALGAVHPVVAHALRRFAAAATVGDVVRETDYSHRRFISLFRQSVGLPPKAYCRMQRFQQALAGLAAAPAPGAVEVALAAGYSDQSHFNREFLEFAGITPGEYRARRPVWPHHVPLN